MDDVRILPEGVLELEIQIAKGLYRVAQEVIARASPPVRSGALRASGNAVVYLHGQVYQGKGAAHLDPGGNAPVAFAYYSDFKARWIEHGTVKMAARPYLGPAELSVEHEIPGIVGEAIR